MHGDGAAKETLMFDEAHARFIDRASAVFPPNLTTEWSRIERAVFNHLMSHLIYRNGYDAITCEMLHETQDQLQQIVRSIGSNISEGHGSAMAVDP
jgi:hypothetical protein